MGVDHVEPAVVDQPAEAPHPAQVPVAGRVQEVGGHTVGLQVGHQVVLVGQQVGGLVDDLFGVGDRGVGDQQALGAARTEALGQPEHTTGPGAGDAI